MAAEQYDHLADRVSEWPGASIRERLSTGRVGHIIDFELDFPDGPLAEQDPTRVDAMEASAVIFDSPRVVDEWELRLPQVPEDGRTTESMAADITSAISQPQTPEFNVYPADGRFSYTPHVTGPNRKPVNNDPVTELGLIRDVWDDYREWAVDEFDPVGDDGGVA